MKSFYRRLIEEVAPGCNSRHVEAFLRSETPTLDHLTRQQFADKVKQACADIDAAGWVFAEQLALSYGMEA